VTGLGSCAGPNVDVTVAGFPPTVVVYVTPLSTAAVTVTSSGTGASPATPNDDGATVTAKCDVEPSVAPDCTAVGVRHDGTDRCPVHDGGHHTGAAPAGGPA
jgi:hypothetical protein